MSKFTVEYKRTVRVRQYETLTIGWMEEFEKGLGNSFDAFEHVKNIVDYLIDENLGRLTKKEG